MMTILSQPNLNYSGRQEKNSHWDLLNSNNTVNSNIVYISKILRINLRCFIYIPSEANEITFKNTKHLPVCCRSLDISRLWAHSLRWAGRYLESTVNPTFIQRPGDHTICRETHGCHQAYFTWRTLLSQHWGLKTVPSSMPKFLVIWILSGAAWRWKKPFWKKKRERQYPVGTSNLSRLV